MVLCLTACASNKHKVTYYDGDQVLKTVNVRDGAAPDAYTPTKDGYSFVGWYSTPSKTHAYDTSTPITADTNIYAGFSQAMDDTRSFYIVGSGTSPLLLSSDWGKAIDSDHQLTKASDSNTYTITCDLMADDEFQFASNADWADKRGFGYLTSNTLPDGTEVFTGSGGLGDVSAKGSNIKCEVSGNYTFTLTTYPADDTYDTSNASYTEDTKEIFDIGTYDTITWTRNGDASAAADVTTDYYIKGNKITNWQDEYSDKTRFVNDGTGVYTLTVPLEEGDEFMFTSTNTVNGTVSTGNEYLRYSDLDAAGQALFDSTDSQNIVVKQAGTYKFVYDSNNKTFTATLAGDAQ
jgi:uncharacterized repeat protein (TIGR02543 family)